MKQLKKTLLTLVALFAMTTGAWADNTETVNITAASVNGTNVTVTATGYNSDTGAWMTYNGETIVVTSKDGSNFEQLVLNIKNNEINAGYVKASPGTCTVDGKKITVTGINASSVTFRNDDSSISISSVEVTFAAPTGTPVPITWSAATPNTASIDKMPAGNVTVSVDYFPQAEFAKSTDPTPVALAPAAIANVPANTDASIVTAGTVANIGTSDVKQGTLMYFVKQADGNTPPPAPDYNTDGWSEDVPTANELKQGDVYVWYYIRGAEPASIADRTDDNTRSDSDIKPLGTTGYVTLGAEPTYDVTFAEGVNPEPPADPEWTADPNTGVKKGQTVTVTYSGTRKVIGVKAEKYVPRTLADATTADVGMVVCAAGHLHAAKTAVPTSCTAVGILGKVTGTGHGLILALKNATNQNWNTINGWASASYAGTTLKVLPDGARGTNLTSYTMLGETTVSNWAVAQKSDYAAIFANLGSTKNSGGMTYDNNVNAYITTDVGGTAMAGTYWSATQDDDYDAWYFQASSWYDDYKTYTYYVRPVLGF